MAAFDGNGTFAPKAGPEMGSVRRQTRLTAPIRTWRNAFDWLGLLARFVSSAVAAYDCKCEKYIKPASGQFGFI